MENSHYQLGIFSYNSLSSLSLNNLDKPANPEGQKLDDTTIVNTSFEPNYGAAQVEPSKHNNVDVNRETNVQTSVRKLRKNLDGADSIEANKFIIRTPKKGILVQKRSLKQSESAYFEKKPAKNLFLDSTTSSSADREPRKILPIKETRGIESKKLKELLELEDSHDSKNPKKVTFAVSEQNSATLKMRLDEIKTLPRATTPKSAGSEGASSVPSRKFEETGSRTTTGFFLNQNFNAQKSKPSPQPSLLIKPGQLSFETFCVQRNFIIRQKSEPQSIFKKEIASSGLQIKLPDQIQTSTNINNLKSLSFSTTATPGGKWNTPSPLNLEKLSVSSSAKITRKQPPLSHRAGGSKVRLNINDLK